MTLDDIIKRLEEIKIEHGGELPVLIYLDRCNDTLISIQNVRVKTDDSDYTTVVIK